MYFTLEKPPVYHSSPSGESLLASQKKPIATAHTSAENVSPPTKSEKISESFETGKMAAQPRLPILRAFVSHQHWLNVPLYWRMLYRTSHPAFSTARVFPMKRVLTAIASRMEEREIFCPLRSYRSMMAWERREEYMRQTHAIVAMEP